MIPKSFYIRVLFFLLVFVSLYDAVYPIFPGFLFQAIQGLALVWLLMSVPKYLTLKVRSPFLSSLIALMLFMTISYVFSGASGFNFFKMFFLSTLAVFPFYVYDIPENKLKKLSIVLLIAEIYSFFQTLSVNRLENENAYGGGYLVLVLLSVGLYFLRKKTMYLQAFWALAVFVLVLYSAKRGDIFACLLSIFVFFLTKILHGKHVKIKALVGLIVLVAIGTYVAMQMLEHNEVLQSRFIQTQNGDSSGRDEGYELLFIYFLDSPLFEQLFGYGFDKTTLLSAWGLRAHNDWLELLLGEGIIGTLPYLIMFLSLIFYSFKKTIPDDIRPILLSIVAIWGVKSFFSMFIFSTPTFVLFMLIGYLIRPQLSCNHS